MSFNCCEFKFNGVSCTQYGLEVYSMDSKNSNGKFFSGAEILEDRPKNLNFPFHYGVSRNKAMTLEFSFGVNQDRIDSGESLTRQEMNDIATWLLQHDDYKYLEMVQSDLSGIRYKCFITELEQVSFDNQVWGFQAKATCDSPYAYMLPETTTIATISGGSSSASVSYMNKSSLQYYKPKIIITSTSSSANNTVTITNTSDSNRQFQITGIPSGSVTITIDNENEVITNNQSLNLYGNLTSYRFFRLVRGVNNLTISGSNVSVKLVSEFPVDVGN